MRDLRQDRNRGAHDHPLDEAQQTCFQTQYPKGQGIDKRHSTESERLHEVSAVQQSDSVSVTLNGLLVDVLLVNCRPCV